MECGDRTEGGARTGADNLLRGIHRTPLDRASAKITHRTQPKLWASPVFWRRDHLELPVPPSAISTLRGQRSSRPRILYLVAFVGLWLELKCASTRARKL